jgi:tRNA-specific 2-thiouridylase
VLVQEADFLLYWGIMKIAVLVSGGVDSSVALQLLVEQGHEVTAFYLKIWLEDEISYLGQCPWEEDLSYVNAVCEQLKVPLQVVNLQKEYHEQVVAYTIDSVRQGYTPNPDVLCNSRIKFGVFFDYLGKHFDKIATGHYAQVSMNNGIPLLMRAPDPIKDQTYFLSYLKPAQLAHVMFPIGHLNKAQVRALATQYQLPTKDRKDSQGICFLGKFKFTDFLKAHVGERSGQLIEWETNMVMGTHQGFWFYTIGQRSGIGLSGGPWYVVAKDPAQNKVFISRSYYQTDKSRKSFLVSQVNWLCEPQKPELTVKLRHGPAEQSCIITPLAPGNYRVDLEQNDQGIAPGQFATFYEGQICLGSGQIIGW